MAGTERGEWREAGKEAKGPENVVTAALEDLLLSKMGRTAGFGRGIVMLVLLG